MLIVSVACVLSLMIKNRCCLCSSILFLEFREWCRNNLSSYYEVFIEAPLDQLIKRDVKGIYARHLRGEIKNVAGLDLDFPSPINSDLIISNSGSKEAFLDFVPTIVDQICME